VLRPAEKRNQRPAMQLEVKTLLNRIQHFVGFVYSQRQFVMVNNLL
jgi:hypothetical protein